MAIELAKQGSPCRCRAIRNLRLNPRRRRQHHHPRPNRVQASSGTGRDPQGGRLLVPARPNRVGRRLRLCRRPPRRRRRRDRRRAHLRPHRQRRCLDAGLLPRAGLRVRQGGDILSAALRKPPFAASSAPTFHLPVEPMGG